MIKQVSMAAAMAVTLGLVFLGGEMLFVVNEIQQALVVELGQLRRSLQTPGLYVKIPFVQNLIMYDKRMLNFDVPAIEITLGDQKRVVIDAFMRYRITDAAMFYKTVRSEVGAQERLRSVVSGTLRSVLGRHPLSALLSQKRAEVMHMIREQVHRSTVDFGIEVVEVRMRRSDLPPENTEAICRRMVSERDKEAREIRSIGQETYDITCADADKTRMEIASQAGKQERILKGDAEAIVARLFGEAFGQDPEFAHFYRSMKAYEKAFDGSKPSVFILSPANSFLHFFRHSSIQSVLKKPYAQKRIGVAGHTSGLRLNKSE